MLDTASYLEPSLTLVLRTEESVNLLYVVELEGTTTRQFYAGENFNQARFVAAKLFDLLKTNNQEFVVYSEEENGSGVRYLLSSDLLEFPLNEEDESYYMAICEEFESKKLASAQDINGLFRGLVGHYKLNEYQEHRLLQKLKQLGYV